MQKVPYQPQSESAGQRVKPLQQLIFAPSITQNVLALEQNLSFNLHHLHQLYIVTHHQRPHYLKITLLVQFLIPV